MKRGMTCCSLMLQISLSCSLYLAGCVIVPVRVTTATKNPSGQKLVVPQQPPVPGKTTRQQVEEQYHAFAVDSGVPNLFWGQFQKSNWAVFWAAGAYYSGDAGGGRVWGTQNMLVTFGETGVAKSVEFVPEKELAARFASMQKEGLFPPLDLSRPVQLEGMKPFQTPTETSVNLELSSTGVTVTMQEEIRTLRKKPRPPLIASIPLAQVAGMHVGDIPNSWNSRFKEPPLSLKLKFSQKTTLGKSINFCAEPRAALTLVRWLEQGKTAKQ